MALIAPEVLPEPTRPQQIQPAASVETFGGGAGLERAGQQSQAISRDAGDIAAFEKIRADQSAVEEAVGSKLSPAVTNMLYDPQNGALARISQTTSMKDALKVHDDTIKQFNDIARKTAGGLSGEYQIGAFNRHAYPMGDSLNKMLMVHVDQQGKKIYQDSFDSFVDNTTAQAALGWGELLRNPNQQKQNIGTLQQHIDDFSASSGQVPDQKKKLESKVFSNYHSAIVDRMLADGQYKAADNYFDQNKSEITNLKIRENIEKSITTVPKQQEALAKYQKEQTQDDNLHDAMINAFKGNLSSGEVTRLFMNDQISKSGYSALNSIVSKSDYQINKFKTMDSPGEESDQETFNRLREAQLSHQLTPGEMTRKILEAHVDGKLSSTDGAYLANQAKATPPHPRDAEVNAAANYVRSRLQTYYDPGTSILGTITNLFHKDSEKQGPNPQIESVVSQLYKQADKTKATGDDLKNLRDTLINTAMRQKFPELGQFNGKHPDVMVTVGGKVIRLLGPDERSILKPKYKITPTPSQDVDQE